MVPEEEFPNEGTGTSRPGSAKPVVQLLTPDGGECWVNEQDKKQYLKDGYEEPGSAASRGKGKGRLSQ